MRIAVGGFQHETNTFAPSKADFDAFARGGGWPPLLQGDEVFDGTAGINLPGAGAVEALRKARHALVPTAWAAASPSAHVTRDAFERIAAMIVDRLRRDDPVDGVYLDLHGAMVTEHVDDGEGELLARVRQVVGPDVPVVASLDLHANVTARMLEHADAFVAYRTYPHVDMAETGARAAAMLLSRLGGAPRPAVAVRRLPYLIPLGSQCTMLEPMASIYGGLPRLEAAGVGSVSFTPGFPAADFAECGPVVMAYGPDAVARLQTLWRGRCWSANRTSRSTCCRPRRGCGEPWPLPVALRVPWSSPIRRTTLVRAAIPTPPACCAPWWPRVRSGLLSVSWLIRSVPAPRMPWARVGCWRSRWAGGPAFRGMRPSTADSRSSGCPMAVSPAPDRSIWARA